MLPEDFNPLVGKLLPVSQAAEVALRRRIYVFVGIAFVLVLTLVMLIVFRPYPAAMVVVFVGIIACKYTLIVTAVKLMGLHYSARSSLRKRGYRVCPGCMYDLEALEESGKCPECGLAFSPESLKSTWEGLYTKLLQKAGR